MMNTQRIRTIIDKEWAEVFKNRLVLFTISLMPLIFTVLPLGILYGTGAASGGDLSGDVADLPQQFIAQCGGAPPGECLQIFILNQFLLLFMMMPLIIPVSIAAYSVVGEKTTHSLEPLLATPISTGELLLGKGLAAAVPAVLATWLAYLVFVLAAPLVGAGPAVMAHLLSPVWLLAILVVGPLASVMAVNFAIMVSSRVNDPRAAEQMAAVIIVPVLVVLFGQLGGLIVLNVGFVLGTILLVAAIDAALVALAVRVFEREAILTRWK
jgi:ABC-2 type transport system permease protein